MKVTLPADMVSSLKAVSRKAKSVAGFPNRKSRFLSFLMYYLSTSAEKWSRVRSETV